MTLISVVYSDVSWGTKGDNKVSTDLGVVKAGKGENAVEVAVPTEETDINAAYEDAIHMLSTKPPKEVKKVDEAQKQEDYYRNFRTKYVLPSTFPRPTWCLTFFFFLVSVLMAWVLSNVSRTCLGQRGACFAKGWLCEGTLGRGYPVSIVAYFAVPPSHACRTLGSTTNGSAKTSGANKTVNGYLIFILYSVALLACTSTPSHHSFTCSLYARV